VIDIDAIDFEKGGGLVTVVCQDHLSGAVLMVAHANREALDRTTATGEMHYWSRTRGLWHKGATSGNTQKAVELRYDCDADAILARVDARLPACHTGSATCFGGLAESAGEIERLDGVIAKRAAEVRGGTGESGPNRAGDIETTQERSPTVGDNTASPEPRNPIDSTGNPLPHTVPAAAGAAVPSYTQRLLGDRNLRLKKLGEEASELVTACADGDRERACEEAADLLYHTLVAVRAVGGSLRDVEAVLARRRSAVG
jgi:phosphoribosyl-ATP pyrophosphohydrolase/phosphoribosyl-AMP cyclohydrolase